MIVCADAARTESDLRAGRLTCRVCAGVLRPWAHARTRTVRTLTPSPALAPAPAASVRVRPRRARCAGCSRTQVLLPGICQPRRADATAVIGAALIANAQGAGHRRIAADLHRSPSTVRSWLRGCPPAWVDRLYQRAVHRIVALAPDLIASSIAIAPTTRRADRAGHNRLIEAMVHLAVSVAAVRTRYPDQWADQDPQVAWSLIAVTAGGLLQPPPRRPG